MSAYQIAVVEDETLPASGAAIIRIEGITQWPQGATVRLLPIDDAAVPPQSEGWPWGDIVPSRVIPTPHGVDIVLAPEIANSPRLLPGTALTVKVAAANIEADARWPDITPTQRRKASAVAMSATQLLAAKAEREKAEKDAAWRRQEMAETAARSARLAAAEGGRAPNTMPAVGPGLKSAEGGQLARLIPLRKPPTAVAAGLPNADTGGHSQLARLTIASGGTNVPAPTTQASARRFSRPWARGAALGFVSGIGAAMLLAAALVLAGPPYFARWLGAATPPVASVGEHVAVANLDTLFRDITSTGAVSPRRKSAANVDIATALSLADHSLRGQRTATETEEAEYWLRRALGAAMGGSEVGWALTQLGTLYAQSDNPRHNYGTAHVLWQIAAAQGDPVAHCFLGTLYEYGLGVPADRKLARTHYQAADAANACRSAKDAAARLKD